MSNRSQNDRNRSTFNLIVAFFLGAVGVLGLFVSALSIARVIAVALVLLCGGLLVARNQRWVDRHMRRTGRAVTGSSRAKFASFISVTMAIAALVYVGNPHKENSSPHPSSEKPSVLTPTAPPAPNSKKPFALNPIRLATLKVGTEPFALAMDGPSVWVANRVSNDVSRVDSRTGRQDFVVKVGQNPVGIAAASGSAWVVNSKDATISRIDSGTRRVTTVKVGQNPSAISIVGANLWISDIAQNVVREVSRSGQVLETVPVGHGPIGQAVGGGYLWIADADDQTVWRIDPTGKQPPAHTNQHKDLLELAWAGDGLWGTYSSDNKVFRLDPITMQVTDTLDVPDLPVGIASDGQSLWVTSENADVVTQIDIGTRQIAGHVPIPNQPLPVAASASVVAIAELKSGQLDLLTSTSVGSDVGSQPTLTSSYLSASPVGLVSAFGSIWVSNGDAGTVTRIDPGDFHVIATVQVGGQELAVGADAKYIWTTDTHSNRVIRIDPHANRVVGTRSVKEGPSSIAVTDTAIWVSEFGANQVEELDPKTMNTVRTVPVLDRPLSLAVGDGSVWVTEASANKVARINELTGNVEAQIPVGNTPGLGLAVTATRVWVTSFDDGKLTEIDPATNGVVNTRAIVQDAGSILVDGDYLWITSVTDTDSKLVRISTTVGSTPDSVAVGKYAQRLIKVGDSYWIACTHSGVVQRLDPPAGQ